MSVDTFGHPQREQIRAEPPPNKVSEMKRSFEGVILMQEVAVRGTRLVDIDVMYTYHYGNRVGVRFLIARYF